MAREVIAFPSLNVLFVALFPPKLGDWNEPFYEETNCRLPWWTGPAGGVRHVGEYLSRLAPGSHSQGNLICHGLSSISHLLLSRRCSIRVSRCSWPDGRGQAITVSSSSLSRRVLALGFRALSLSVAENNPGWVLYRVDWFRSSRQARIFPDNGLGRRSIRLSDYPGWALNPGVPLEAGIRLVGYRILVAER